MSVFLRLPKPANGPASGGRELAEQPSGGSSNSELRRRQRSGHNAAPASSSAPAATNGQHKKKTATVISNRNENTVNYRKIPAGQAGATYMRQM